MFDPHKALSLEDIWLLVDELLEAHGDMILFLIRAKLNLD